MADWRPGKRGARPDRDISAAFCGLSGLLDIGIVIQLQNCAAGNAASAGPVSGLHRGAAQAYDAGDSS
jgi:hypothetical protein